VATTTSLCGSLSRCDSKNSKGAVIDKDPPSDPMDKDRHSNRQCELRFAR
jgi:hypothetical protein